jgi:tetratricopeptide (TPR) repeat protein
MLADSQMKSNYTNDAVETYKYLIPIEERIYGQNHQETLCLKCELGKLFLIKKDFKEAESLFKVIHSTCITLFGKDHPQTNSINAQLAKLHLITKQYQKSIDIYQNCIHITILHNGEKSEITLQYMYELALVYAEMGLTSEAIKYLDRCILLGSDLYGQNHPTICEWIDYRSKKLIKKKWLFF